MICFCLQAQKLLPAGKRQFACRQTAFACRQKDFACRQNHCCLQAKAFCLGVCLQKPLYQDALAIPYNKKMLLDPITACCFAKASPHTLYFAKTNSSPFFRMSCFFVITLTKPTQMQRPCLSLSVCCASVFKCAWLVAQPDCATRGGGLYF